MFKLLTNQVTPTKKEVDEYNAAKMIIDPLTGLTNHQLEDGYNARHLPGYKLLSVRSCYYPHGDACLFVREGARPKPDAHGSIPVVRLWMRKSGGDYYIVTERWHMYL